MTKNEPWNKGRVVGQSQPLTPEQVDLIWLIFGQYRARQSFRNINTTVRYLRIDREEALDVARKYHL